MALVQVNGTGLSYHLIAFDAEGRERPEDGGLASRGGLQALAQGQATDVFLFSHGWQGDIPGAQRQYDAWIGVMVACGDDIERMKQARSGAFQPLLIGLHWPSLPWGDESLGGPGTSFAPVAPPTVERLVDEYAERIADTPAAREALRCIIEAARTNPDPDELPEEVKAAYEALDRESGLGSAGVGAAPGDDREPFRPELIYGVTRSSAAVSFGAPSLGGVLSPLRTLSFWKMKDRARHFGESGAHDLLKALQQSVPSGRNVRFHLMGHSFGCIVVSAMLAGPGSQAPLAQPVDSVVLVQGALSIWSYCDAIPGTSGKAGYFHSIVAGRRVRGPIISTQSQYDTAVGRWYPLAAGAARQVTFVPGQLPKYGGVGTFGIRGLDRSVADMAMLRVDRLYGFEAGRIYNIESSGVIRNGGGFSGAHSDIAQPEVAHAVWEAALG